MSRHMLRSSRLTGALIAVMMTAAPAAAQLPANVQDVLRRIHTTQEFGGGGQRHTRLQPVTGPPLGFP